MSDISKSILTVGGPGLVGTIQAHNGKPVIVSRGEEIVEGDFQISVGGSTAVNYTYEELANNSKLLEYYLAIDPAFAAEWNRRASFEG